MPRLVSLALLQSCLGRWSERERRAESGKRRASDLVIFRVSGASRRRINKPTHVVSSVLQQRLCLVRVGAGRAASKIIGLRRTCRIIASEPSHQPVQSWVDARSNECEHGGKMFATLDVAVNAPRGEGGSAADRVCHNSCSSSTLPNELCRPQACDLCKQRKVRCDMAKPCKTCSGRNLACTYNQVRKKRGPASGRLAKMKNRQSVTSIGENVPETSRTMSVVSLISKNLDESPTANDDPSNARARTASLHNLAVDDANTSQASEFWAPATMPHQLRPTDSVPQPTWTSHVAASEETVLPMTTMQQDLGMPEFMIPSLPIESPTDDSYNLFTAMLHQDQPPVIHSTEIWPATISQEALLPWIDIYFKRLHPTVPVLSRTVIYQEMLLRTHHHDPHFGAMLLALCAFAMTQPVQIHEVASTPSRSVQARMLLEESIKMRMTVDFGENPSVYMILTSFFIFACLFGNDKHKAAHHRLREAVDLANSLSMHMPQAYDSLDLETREQWLRTYLVLSVTERYFS